MAETEKENTDLALKTKESVEKKPLSIMGTSLFSAGGIAIVLVILVLVNVIISQVSIRWDVTKDKLYSLSQGSINILDKLEKDVSIKVFYSKDNINTPLHVKNFGNRLLDFLKEYEYHSKGKITVEVYNAKPDTEEEEWAQKYGINPIDLPMGDRIYFGLVALCGDQEEVMPTIDPTREEHLEYDMTRLITRVQSPKMRKIGIISSQQVFGMPPQMQFQMQQQGAQPWVFIEELKKTYHVEEIPMSAKDIDSEIDLLILLHPKELSESLQYAIDQFVLKGKNAIVFVDPMAVTDSTPGYQKSSSLPKLFKAWGISMEDNKVLLDFDHPTKLRNASNQVEDNPTWLSMPNESLSQSDIITAKLENLLFPLAGVFKKTTDSQYEYEPLIQSSTNSAVVEAFRANFGIAQLRRDFKPSFEKHDIAVKVRGSFSTAFPDGKPKDEESTDKPADPSDDPKKDHIAKSETKSTIIVVADSDLLFDNYYVRKQNFLGFNMFQVFNDNLNFLLNSAEMLTGNEELISIRSRGKFERPFTKVQELEKKAQAKWLDRERELTKKADETNQKLRDLEKQKDDSQRFIISKEQEEEIQRFQEEKKRVNQELKEVRRNLRSEIDSLGNLLKFINIIFMPLCVSLVGIFYGLYRRKKSITGA